MPCRVSVEMNGTAFKGLNATKNSVLNQWTKKSDDTVYQFIAQEGSVNRNTSIKYLKQ